MVEPKFSIEITDYLNSLTIGFDGKTPSFGYSIDHIRITLKYFFSHFGIIRNSKLVKQMYNSFPQIAEQNPNKRRRRIPENSLDPECGPEPKAYWGFALPSAVKNLQV